MDWSQTWLGVANKALTRINKQVLQTLDDSSTSAMLCNQLLPSCVRSVLNQYDWKSSRKRTAIAPQLASPAFGFERQFRLPTDFVRLVTVYSMLPWKREGNLVLSDEEVLRISYVAYPSTPDALDSLVLDAIATQLAAELSVSLTSDSTITNLLMQEVEIKIQKAKLQEQAGEPDILTETNSWSEAFDNAVDSLGESDYDLMRRLYGERED